MKKIKINKNLLLALDKKSGNIDLLVDHSYTGYNEKLNKYYIRLKLKTVKELKERIGKMSSEIFKDISL